MSEQDRVRWNRRYRDGRVCAPGRWMLRVARTLPRGRALDAGCGDGATAVALAKLGFRVDAMDVSDVALDRARIRAERRGARVRFLRRDLVVAPRLGPNYSLVVNRFCFFRPLCRAITRALRPGGLLLFQAYTPLVRRERPSFRTAWTTTPSEIRRLLRGLEIRRLAVVGPAVRVVAVRPRARGRREDRTR